MNKVVEKNRAKIAGQQRHTLGTLASVLIGMNIADEEQINSVIVVLESIGITSEIQIIIAALVIVGVHGASWLSRAKKQGEGDPE